MKLLLTALLLTLTACGAEIKPQSMKPLIGIEGAKSYFTDRNMTGTDFQNFTDKIASDTGKAGVSSKAKIMASLEKVTPSVKDAYTDSRDKVAATKHKAAGYMVDRNLAGSAFKKQADDYEAKVRRKAMITKGYTSDRLDQIKDPDRKEREQIKDLQNRADVVDGRLSSAESRIAAEEAKSAAQALLIEQMALATELRFMAVEGRISASEQVAKDYADANDSDTVFDPEYLEELINLVEADVASLISRVGAAETTLNGIGPHTECTLEYEEATVIETGARIQYNGNGPDAHHYHEVEVEVAYLVCEGPN